MKSRTLLYTLIGSFALAIGFLWSYLSTNNQENLTVLPATINRDCAPWDGAAFTMSIPYNSVSVITIQREIHRRVG